MNTTPDAGHTCGDLTPQERGAWMDRDVAGYFAAAEVWARDAAERQVQAALRRRKRESLRRLTSPLRWPSRRRRPS